MLLRIIAPLFWLLPESRAKITSLGRLRFQEKPRACPTEHDMKQRRQEENIAVSFMLQTLSGLIKTTHLLEKSRLIALLFLSDTLFARFKTRISTTRGENKNFYPLSLLVIDFFPPKSLTGGWEIIFDQPNFQEGYKIEVFIFATGGSTYHILVFWRKGIL